MFRISTLALSLLLPMSSAHAQVCAPGSLTLSQSLSLSKQHLDIQLAQQAIVGAQAEVLAANRSPYPALSTKVGSIDLQNGVGAGDPLLKKRLDKSVGLEFTWERGGKRVLRTAVAEQNLTAVRQDAADTERQQLLGAIAAFYDLASAIERVEQIRALETVAKDFAGVAKVRFQAGDISQQDALRADVEAKRAQGDVAQAESERKRAALVLAQYIGQDNRDAGCLHGLKLEAVWPSMQNRTELTSETMEKFVSLRPDINAALARIEAGKIGVDAALAQKRQT